MVTLLTPALSPTHVRARTPAPAQVKMGVPEQAVRNKMRLEGFNPELLDTPDAPYP